MTLSISSRFQAITVSALLGVAIVSGIGLKFLGDQVERDRLAKTRNLTDAAYGVLAFFEREEADGRLPRMDAQNAAIRAIKNLRYDEQEYFWLTDKNARMVAHPMKPELDGKDMAEMKDPTGKHIFLEFANVVKQRGQGFIEYYWPKPGEQAPAAKISYVRGFAPWGWIIGTGVYADDTGAILWQAARQAGIAMFLVIALTAALVVLLSRQITVPLKALNSAMRRLAAGDLNTDVPSYGKSDEIGAMAASVLVFKTELLSKAAADTRAAAAAGDQARRSAVLERLVIHFRDRVGELSRRLGSAASDLEVTARAMDVSVERTTAQSAAATALAGRTSADVQTAAAATEEMSASVREIVGQVHRTSEIVALATESARQGESIVRDLALGTEKIGDVVGLISSIAAQTNLLALNATIEAARAGDAGRGFAVVASEVKELAGQTAKATDEIAGQIGRIQGETRQAVLAISTVGQTIEELHSIAIGVAAAMEEQNAAIEEIVRGVASAATGAQSVSESMDAVRSIAADNGDASKQVLVSARGLSKNSHDLDEAVQEFLAGVLAA
ncbi:methyl-accepting chemotaxis protein [Methylorubrum thiocyanatum]|uniref:methyl-accepting chemotaxis protein n=1 Tax=Methylorubrum thiocyanatum TaxID=47958 RepID=UPI00383BF3AF